MSRLCKLAACGFAREIREPLQSVEFLAETLKCIENADVGTLEARAQFIDDARRGVRHFREFEEKLARGLAVRLRDERRHAAALFLRRERERLSKPSTTVCAADLTGMFASHAASSSRVMIVRRPHLRARSAPLAISRYTVAMPSPCRRAKPTGESDEF
jgi:hypothetical protein